MNAINQILGEYTFKANQDSINYKNEGGQK